MGTYTSLPGNQDLLHVLVRAHTAGWLTWCELPAIRYQHAYKPSVCCVVFRVGGWDMASGQTLKKNLSKKKFFGIIPKV